MVTVFIELVGLKVQVEAVKGEIGQLLNDGHQVLAMGR